MLGRSQAVRQRFLKPSCDGSIPSAPAIFRRWRWKLFGMTLKEKRRRFARRVIRGVTKYDCRPANFDFDRNVAWGMKTLKPGDIGAIIG